MKKRASPFWTPSTLSLCLHALPPSIGT
jgi:hypothetical protein